MNQINIAQEKQLGLGALELYRKELSIQPAVEGVIGDMFSSLVGRVKNMYSKLFNAAKDTQEPPNTDNFDQTTNKVNARNFVDLSGLEVASMEGFKGNYRDYAQTLLASITMYEEFIEPELKRVEIFMGDVLTNKESAKSFKDMKPEVKRSQEMRKTDDQSHAAFWNAGSFKVQVKVNEVLRNSAEMQEIKTMIAQMSKHLKAVKMDQLISRVGRINDIATNLADGISSGSVSHMSKQQASNIGEALWELALLMEHYSINRYRIHTFMTAVDRLGVVLKKAV